jgi:hypothetical protein
MYMLRRWIPAFLAATVAASAAFCQEADTTRFYKLDFVAKEVEGTKVVNSRAYSTVTSVGDKSNIRAESKISWARKTDAGTQYQQYNVGIGIDVHVVKEFESRLSIYIAVSLDTIAADESALPAPVVRQNKWSSTLVVPFKKPTIVFTSDNPDSKRQMQIEVTAIPVS